MSLDRSTTQRSSWESCSCCEGLAEMVVMGRPVKSRSLLGCQSQKRQALMEVRVELFSSPVSLSEMPPNSWRARASVSLSTRRS